ncbi:MAG: ribonuclease P protein component [Acholeplasmatales bacterium]|nr:ribonuclease P protein component [Acholeplasmatales bacterium]
MKKEYRVKKNQEIELILKNKIYKSNQYFSVYKRINEETSHFRYAISVGKKIGDAVVRNKYKRKITAALSNLNINLDINVDVFIIAKPSICNVDYNIIYKELAYLFKKLNLLQGEKHE